MPELLTVGNWKMNTTVPEAVALALSVRRDLVDKPVPDVGVVLCPPYLSLPSVSESMEGSPVMLGAQNAFYEPKGAFTGEISPAMLAGLCEFIIIGHSERRILLRESHRVINRKIKAVLESGIRPILCVGETLEQRRSGSAARVVARQIASGLNGVSDVRELVVAYEPVWAIGTGLAATPAVVIDIVKNAIRTQIHKMYGASMADGLPVLYGGSVNPDNVSEFLEDPSIHGTLVGGVSLIPDQFLKIVRLTSEIKG